MAVFSFSFQNFCLSGKWKSASIEWRVISLEKLKWKLLKKVLKGLNGFFLRLVFLFGIFNLSALDSDFILLRCNMNLFVWSFGIIWRHIQSANINSFYEKWNVIEIDSLFVSLSFWLSMHFALFCLRCIARYMAESLLSLTGLPPSYELVSYSRFCKHHSFSLSLTECFLWIL